MDLDFIDFIVFLGMAQGLFLAITLPMAKDGNKEANTFLSILLVLACTMLTARIFLFQVHEAWALQLGNVADILIFLFGPFAYFYIKRLLFNSNPPLQIDYWHFLPAAIFSLFLIYVYRFTAHDYLTKLLAGDFYYAFMVIEGAAIMLNLFYAYKIYGLLKKYQDHEKEQLSFSQGVIRFSKLLLRLALAIVLIWTLSYLSQYLLRSNLPLINYETIWMALPILIYVIGFYALRQPEIFRVTPTPKETNTIKSRLSEEEIDQLKKRLELLIEQEQVFLDNKLTLNKLSEKLKTSTNNLSWLLNNIYKTTFYEYINQFRIAAFLNKVENKEHLEKTLLALSFEVGFNSKSVFNKAFKSFLNETPSNYIKNLKG